MKLLNISFTKPRYWVLGLALAAGAGSAQAQFTGIGTTAPTATLHVTPIAPADEVLRVNGVKDLNTATETTYVDVLVYDPASGLFRRESVADLLNNNGEFVYDATARTLTPRRTNLSTEFIIRETGVGVTNNLTVGGNAAITGNAAVTGNGTITGTLGVTGAGTFAANLTVNGNTALATSAGQLVTLANLARVPTAPATTVPATSQVLLRNATTFAIEYAQLDDLIKDNGQWIEDGTELKPRVAAYTNTIGITATAVNVKEDLTVAKNASITGNAAITGTLGVTGAATLASTLNVTGATTLQSTLSIGSVPERAPLPADGTDKILIQRATGTLVEHVTVADLLQNNGEWRFDATTDLIYANRARTAGNQIVATNSGNFGIGTAAPAAKLQVASGSILVDADQGINFGAATKSLRGVGTDLTLASSGAFNETVTGAHVMTAASSNVTTTGTITHNAGGPSAILNANGFSIGVPTGAIAGRHLQTNLADGLEFGSLTQVNNVTTAGIGTATTSVFERVLITDANGVVRYITAGDLTQNSSEWRDGGPTTDYIYAFQAKTPGAADVVVRDNGNFGIGTIAPSEKLQIVAGNIQLDVTQTLQWGASGNTITNTGITASAAYTVRNGADADVSFFEGTSTTPWLFHKAVPTGGPTGEIGRVGINTNDPLATLHVAGNIVASNSAVTSDRRFKDQISELSGALNAVKALRGVTYKFRADEFPKEHFDRASHIGFIAQELREVLPMAVFERGDGFLTVDYGAVTPVLVEAMQELSAKVEALEAENAALRGNRASDAVGAVSTKQLRDLEARLAAMDARLEAATAGRK